MNPVHEPYGLQCPDGRQAQLLSVQVHAEILGLMLRLTVRQTWRNTSGAPMATQLHFPLGWEQTLLDLKMHRPQGQQELGAVTRHNRQRCSAIPGVLSTGEEVTLQWRIGQLISLQGGSLRLQLPAALVPRAKQAAQIELDLHGPVAQGTVACASHELQRVRHANGLRLSLRAPEGLSKDLVLTVHGLRDIALAVASPNPGSPQTCTVLMSAAPRPMPATDNACALQVKLLMESTGSLPCAPPSALSCTLDKLLAQLHPQDQISYSRFGTHTVHDLPRLQVCTEAYLRRARALVRHSDALPGPANPLAALQSVLTIPDEHEHPVAQADILLITASPIWAIEAPLRALRATGHRLHVLALGMAADSLWRELAEASGGACEVLNADQHSLPTLSRWVQRMRQRQPQRTWFTLEGCPMQDQERTLCQPIDGDTLHQWARVPFPRTAQDLTGHPQWQAQWRWHTPPAPPQDLPPSPVLWDEQGDLARLCAARDALTLEDQTERARWLTQHGLIQPDMHRPPDLPEPTEPTFSVPETAQRPKILPRSPSLSPVDRVTAPTPFTPAHRLRPAPARATPLAEWLGEPDAAGNPLTALVQGFNVQATSHGRFRAALSGTLQQVPTRFLDTLVLQLTRQAGNPGRVWALILHWLHAEHAWPLADCALALLEQELANTSVSLRTHIFAALNAASVPTQTRSAA